jgi:hypothetical protein
MVPTVGPVKARAWSYERIEQHSERDLGAITITFIEDVPDDEAASQWQAPQAASVAAQYAAEYNAGFEGLGLDGDPLGDIIDFCEDLQALVAAPGQIVDSIESRGSAVLQELDNLERSFTSAVEGPTPRTSRPRSSIHSRSARIARCGASPTRSPAASRRSSRRRSSPARFPIALSIFDVALRIDQDTQKLIQLNQALPDLLVDPRRTLPVRVYADNVASGPSDRARHGRRISSSSLAVRARSASSRASRSRARSRSRPRRSS